MPVKLPEIPLPDGDRWLSFEDVRRVFGVHRKTLTNWIREAGGNPPKLKPYRPSFRIFFKLSDVNALLASRSLPTIP